MISISEMFPDEHPYVVCECGCEFYAPTGEMVDCPDCKKRWMTNILVSSGNRYLPDEKKCRSIVVHQFPYLIEYSFIHGENMVETRIIETYKNDEADDKPKRWKADSDGAGTALL